MNILIADDELRLRKVVAMYLKKSGNEVIEASSGEQALEYLEKNQVDVIVMDVQMPGMGGIETCKEIKSNNKYNNIPLILLTANIDSLDVQKGKDAGADEYITKPFSPKDLMDTIIKLVPKSK